MLAPLKRVIWLISLALLWLQGCSDLKRDNPLDPKNAQSKQPRLVLIEAYVNQVAGPAMEAAWLGLERLQLHYSADQLMIIEHHIQRSAATDSLALAASLARYEFLVTLPSQQGIPDVFFDGSFARVQGASDAETVFNRYVAALEVARTRAAYVTIEAQAEWQGTQLLISGELARLGVDDIEAATLYAVLLDQGIHPLAVVRIISPVETFGRIRAGERRSFERMLGLPGGITWQQPVCILLMQNDRTLEIDQTARIEISGF